MPAAAMQLHYVNIGLLIYYESGRRIGLLDWRFYRSIRCWREGSLEVEGAVLLAEVDTGLLIGAGI